MNVIKRFSTCPILKYLSAPSLKKMTSSGGVLEWQVGQNSLRFLKREAKRCFNIRKKFNNIYLCTQTKPYEAS